MEDEGLFVNCLHIAPKRIQGRLERQAQPRRGGCPQEAIAADRRFLRRFPKTQNGGPRFCPALAAVLGHMLVAAFSRHVSSHLDPRSQWPLWSRG